MLSEREIVRKIDELERCYADTPMPEDVRALHDWYQAQFDHQYEKRDRYLLVETGEAFRSMAALSERLTGSTYVDYPVRKLIDNHYTLEGLFPVVLMANSTKERHWFATVNDGGSTVKAPMGMFEQAEIDNDLKAVDSAIRSYWGLEPLTDNEKKEG